MYDPKQHNNKAHLQKRGDPQHPVVTPNSPTVNTSFVQRMSATPQAVVPTDLLQWQRMVGNQAVMRMLAGREKPSSNLQVGPADDHHERAADQMAQRVSTQLSGVQGGGNAVQRKPLPTGGVKVGPEGGAVDQAMASQIQAGKQGGQPVPDAIQRAVGKETGADFSAVRVHTDQNAQQVNRALNARAFTQGKHIFLGASQSPHDVQLMAHEMTHTIQQGAVPHNADQASADVQRANDNVGTIQRKLNPDTVITNLQQAGVPNFTPVAGTPAKYSITVAVAKGMEDHPLFSKKRMKSKIRNTVRSMVRGNAATNAMVRAPKTGDQIKEKAAKRVIRAEDKRAQKSGAAASTTPADQRAQDIMDSSDDVGHSWIKFNMLDASGQILKTYSFGFIPAQHPDNPTVKVPGLVRNPDMEFEAEPSVRYSTTAVSSKSFAKAVERTAQLEANPPQYSTMGYNCTKFTREVAKQGSASYPGGTGMIIPIHNIGGGLTIRDKSYMPGRLFDKLDGKANVSDSSTEQQMLQSGKYQEDDKGTLVSKEQKRQEQERAEAQRRANMSASDVANFLMDNSNIPPRDKAAWEDEGLTMKMLQTLLQDKSELWRAYDNENGFDKFQVGMLYQTFGFPINGMPGTMNAQRPGGAFRRNF